jgi:hypothetical protein
MSDFTQTATCKIHKVKFCPDDTGCEKCAQERYEVNNGERCGECLSTDFGTEDRICHRCGEWTQIVTCKDCGEVVDSGCCG